MQMIRWMCGISLKDKRTNEEMRRLVGVFFNYWKIYYKEQIEDIIYSYLHEKRKMKDAYIKKSEEEE